MSSSVPNWVELDGAVNTRDVGGLPAEGGRTVRAGVLIRSANLQHLTAQDVQRLTGELGVRRIVDLRTNVEVHREGPGPLHREPDVTIHHLSLYPDTPLVDTVTELSDDALLADAPLPDAVSDALDPSGAAVSGKGVPDPLNPGGVAEALGTTLPWHRNFATGRDPVVDSYLRYLQARPDSLVAALRAIAEPEGATVVHCAAGKDRTGVVIALALSVAGVPDDVIAADYAATESQLAAIVSHLSRSDLYAREVSNPEAIPIPTAQVMTSVLGAIDEDHGGVLDWLGEHGWTDVDTGRLRTKLLG